MTRHRLSPVGVALVFGVAAFVGAAALGAIHDLAAVILVVNVWAAAVVVRIMWHYHRTTDWQDNPVGRTTMGIKGVILMLLAVGIGRRTQEFASLHGAPWLASSADAVTDTVLTTAWVLLAVVMTLQLHVIWALQSTNSSEPEPPA